MRFVLYNKHNSAKRLAQDKKDDKELKYRVIWRRDALLIDSDDSLNPRNIT